MRIPKETTLKQRLEFYESALEMMDSGEVRYICHAACHYYNVPYLVFEIGHIKVLFPELYETRDYSYDLETGGLLWNSPSYSATEERIIALNKAIETVKSKLS